MAIKSIEIEQFLIFKEKFSADFCKGVNILIGSNGCGKTTLMKVMYAMCKFSFIEDGCNAKDNYKAPIKPVNFYFDVNEEFLSVDAKGCVVFDTLAANGSPDYTLFFVNPTDGNYYMKISETFKCPSVFIPTEEMLSHSKGFLALCNERKMPFDQTQIDILSKASIPEKKEITPNATKVIDKIKNIIGGNVIYENDTFYVLKDNNEKIPFSLEASGFRKLGLLWKLLRNGLLEHGTVLFWDEPENSLNPGLVPALVDILLELQKNGVQIFIATQNNIIARWFEENATKENALMYFNMRKTENGIEYNTADTNTGLTPSVLEDADEKLFNTVVKNGLGVN
jgi:AAA15 family ATPase/GTPase